MPARGGSRAAGAPRARTLLAIGFAVLAMTPSRGRAADAPLLLAVQVNGFAVGKIGEFVVRDGVAFARPAELTDLGFRLPAGLAATDGLIRLTDIPGLKWRLDAATQTIYITASDADLTPALLRPTPPPSRRARPRAGPVRRSTTTSPIRWRAAAMPPAACSTSACSRRSAW